jgi:hypothetical protein
LKKASEYRQHDLECRRLAGLAPAEQRQKLLSMAAIWDAFAEERGKSDDSRDPVPPTVPRPQESPKDKREKR